MTARQMGAKCIIMTFRDMTTRLQSGFKYAMKKATEPPKTTFDERFGPKISKQEVPNALFGRSHLTYLNGISAKMCAEEKFEVHLLCTETLDAELVRLNTIFPGIHVQESHAHNNEAGYKGMNRSTFDRWMEASMPSATMVEYVNEMYMEDQIIHDLICASHRGRGF